jgi:hypothetical protein
VGFCHFDNFGNAVLTLFTSISLEGWADAMYRLMDSFGSSVLVAAYFVLLIMLGGFLVMNLAIAVLFDEYDKGMERDRVRQAAKRAVVNMQVLLLLLLLLLMLPRAYRFVLFC